VCARGQYRSRRNTTPTHELEEAGRTWAAATCAAQGISLKMADPLVLDEVVTLLWAGHLDPGPAHARQTGASRSGSKRLRPRRPGPTSMNSTTAETIAC
jgi:hypothetical protein